MHTPEPVPAWFSSLLVRELGPWMQLSATQIEHLHHHYALLLQWNRKMSLTSVKPGPQLVMRHYCESLFFGAHLPAAPHAIVLDIGSGGGFPGVPLAILRPDWQVVLVESVQRKAVFLRESTRSLRNVRVIAERAEELKEKCDWAVSRAVDPREVLRATPRLVPRVGLMLGEGDLPEIQQRPDIAWTTPLRLPWGDRRLCVYGEFVSRGTWLR